MEIRPCRCPRLTAAISRTCTARASICLQRRWRSNFAPMRIPMTVSGGSARLGGRQEQCRVDEFAVERDAEVQMRTGDTAGGANLADDRAAVHRLTDLHADDRQVAVHRDQALAVIDQYRIAIKKIVAGIDDLAVCRGVDRCPGRSGNVHAGMRRARLVVEHATPAEGAGAYA